MMRQNYDLVIIGGGPGGYTAALYGARAGLQTLVLERLSVGGQMALTHQIDNYPGFENGIDGYSLAGKMKIQAERFGAESGAAEVVRLKLSSNPKVIETSEGVVYGKAVILAMGADPRRLGIEKEQELIGRGISYCAACDGMFYKDQTVVVVGGGDSAAADALLLSRIAKKVILVHRRNVLRAAKIYHQMLSSTKNVEFCWNTEVTEFLYQEYLTGVRLKNTKNGQEMIRPCDGVFICAGRVPATELVKGQIALDDAGYIQAGEDTKTNIAGVYAVGDLRTKLFRQVVTAVSDGAAAAYLAEEYVSRFP